MTSISEIRRGCGKKKHILGDDMQICDTGICGVDYLCPSCQALLTQAESIIEEIEKFERNLKDFIWDACGKEMDIREKILMYIEKKEKELKSSIAGKYPKGHKEVGK